MGWFGNDDEEEQNGLDTAPMGEAQATLPEQPDQDSAPQATPVFNLADYSPEKRQALVDATKETTNPFAAAISAIGAGISGGDVGGAFNQTMRAGSAKAQADLDAFDQNRELGIKNAGFQKDQTKFTQDQDKLKRESDPNSLESKTAQSLAISMGMNPDQAKQLTASKFKDFSPALEKRYQVAERTKDRQLLAQSQKDARDAMSQQRDTASNDKLYDRLTANLKDDLDPNKGRAGNLAFNQKKVDQAERLGGLIKDANGQISNLDSRQIEELAIGLNSMLSNSSSSAVSQVKALVPSTAMGDATHLKEWLMNDPTGTNQTAFVKRMADTVEREKSIASDQIKKAQVQRLSAYTKLKNARPDDYQAVVNAYGIDPSKDIDEKGNYISRLGKEGPPAAPKLVTVTQNGHTFQVPEDLIKKPSALTTAEK